MERPPTDSGKAVENQKNQDPSHGAQPATENVARASSATDEPLMEAVTALYKRSLEITKSVGVDPSNLERRRENLLREIGEIITLERLADVLAPTLTPEAVYRESRKARELADSVSKLIRERLFPLGDLRRSRRGESESIRHGTRGLTH